MGIVLAILLFGFIVFFHELGHFLLARINGINVYEFWIGMGPTLAHKDRKYRLLSENTADRRCVCDGGR